MVALFRRVCLRAVVLGTYCALLGCGVGGHEPDLRTLIYFHVCIKFYILRSRPAHFFFATNCRRPGTNQGSHNNCSRISIYFTSRSLERLIVVHISTSRPNCAHRIGSVRPVSSHGTEAGLPRPALNPALLACTVELSFVIAAWRKQPARTARINHLTAFVHLSLIDC